MTARRSAASTVRLKETPSVRLVARAHFNCLFRHAEFVEALTVLKEWPGASNEAMVPVRLAFTLAHLPNGLARARAVYDEQRATRDGQPFVSRLECYPQFVLLLLGQKTQARAAGRKMCQREQVELNIVVPHTHQWLAGEISDDELLRLAGSSRWTQCERHFCVAMSRLADGDRAGARAHFEKAVATRILHFIEYEWSRSFLAQMDRDPKWPTWIP